MQTQITYQNGRTYDASLNQTQWAWRKFMNDPLAFELASPDKEQADDMRPLLMDYSLDSPEENSWDPTDYGPGCEGTDEELESELESLDKQDTELRFELRYVYLSTKNAVELSKAGKYDGYLHWGQAWKDAKSRMAEIRAELKKNAEWRRTVTGELRARSTEAHPELTRWFTSDLPGMVDQTEDFPASSLACDIPDPALHGIDAPTHLGDLEKPSKRCAFARMADPIRKWKPTVTRRK